MRTPTLLRSSRLPLTNQAVLSLEGVVPNNSDMSVSPHPRPRAHSFLNDPPSEPSEPSDVPSHSILLNGPGSVRDPSPGPSTTSSEHSHGHSEAESVATRASHQSVSFAPLPIIPPELKRRSSITLGVAARKNLLSSPEDNIYPDPRRKAGQNQGGIQKVYMNDADWEEYKRHHAEKNGNDPVDLGDLVKDSAKNLWRKVRSSPSPKQENLGASPTPSTSSFNSVNTTTNSKTGSSPSTASNLLSNLTSPRMSIRRRGSDPGAALNNSNSAQTTKTPALPDVEEEALSRMQSAEAPLVGTSPGINAHVMDWQKNTRTPHTEEAGTSTEHTHEHGPPSPPPRVQDVLPSQDEVHETQESPGQSVQEAAVQSMELEEGGALGLEKVDIQSEAGDGPDWKHQQVWNGNKRDSEVLGFDRRRFGGAS